MSSLPKTPLVPIVLGLSGLIPFLACALALSGGFALPLIGGTGATRLALVVYAIAILSFLGGVRWGIAMSGDQLTRDYVISVTPALIGWAAIGLSRPRDLWMLCVAFVIYGLLDYGMACRVVAPEWYGRLRLFLSAVAALCLGIAAVVS
jgi:hypothetical protein